MKSIEFLVERIMATCNVAAGLNTGLNPWVWLGKPNAQWTTDCGLVDQLRIAEITKRAGWRAAVATWELSLSQIQRITRDVKREGLYHFREQPAVAGRFRTLRTHARSRDEKYKQGEMAHQVWAKADAAWVYATTPSLSEFGSLLAASLSQRTVQAGEFEDWRKAASTLMSTARKFDLDCVAWYAAATRKFKKGTEQGDTIRSVVPTTYNPPPPVGQALISNIMVSGGMLHFDCTALHATRFTYLHMPPGSPVFLVLYANSPLTSITLANQPPGLHRFKAIPRNSGGEGQESEVIEITVAVEAAA